MIDSHDQKLTHSDSSHVIPKSIGKDRQKKTRMDFWAVIHRDDDRFLGRDMTGKRWGCRVALDGRAVSGGMFHVLGSTWHPSYTDSMKNLFLRPWWRVWEDF